MSKKVMKYSVLRYTPSKAAGEFINIGVLFVDEEKQLLHFSYIKKKHRLSVFDDEIDTKGVERLLQSICEETTNMIEQDQFSLNEYIRFYTNSYVFSDPKNIVYDDFDVMVGLLEKTFLKFDFDKKERLNKKEEHQIFKKMCLAQKIEIKSNYEAKGQFNEKVKYDFATSKYYIKIFDYKGKKNLIQSINSAKLWAWNADHADRPLIILFRYEQVDEVSDQEFYSIMEIFKSANIRIYDFSEMDKVIALVA